MGRSYASRVSQSFRLPLEVAEMLESMARERSVSKTDIVAEAIVALRKREADELITEGMCCAARELREQADALVSPLREVVAEW